MTTRKLTKEQFEDATVLDTERLEGAIGDAFEALNNIGPDVDTSSMLQKQVIFGETPPRWDQTDRGLFLAMNFSPWLPVPPVGLTNIEERLKSNDPRGISTVTQSGSGYAGNGYCWQVAFWTECPIVVTDLDIAMHMNEPADLANHPYFIGPSQMIWDNSTQIPAPLANGDFLEDVVVSVTVDSPYNQQDAAEVSLTVHKNFFSLDSQRFNRNTNDWETDDMLPSPTKNAFTRGWWYQAKEVNAPIPAKSRVRINIFVPNWNYRQAATDPTLLNGWTYGDGADFNRTAYSRFLWSGTLTFLERKA